MVPSFANGKQDVTFNKGSFHYFLHHIRIRLLVVKVYIAQGAPESMDGKPVKGEIAGPLGTAAGRTWGEHGSKQVSCVFAFLPFWRFDTLLTWAIDID